MTFIIAEVGSNFESFTQAKDSVSMAKTIGADAVKFQYLRYSDLYVNDATIPLIKIDELRALKEKADSVGIEFMCTAFSPEAMLEIDPLVKRHKIASSDLSYVELLETANKLGKPVILSVGASSLTDIGLALQYLSKVPVTLLYCVSSYPAKNVNLFHLEKLKEFGKPVGYSCHTTDFYTPVAAVKYHKAEVIEKHFKLLPDLTTPDSGHSLPPKDFKRMIDIIRGHDQYLSFPSPDEKDMLLRHNRRLVITKEVKQGEKLIYKTNYGSYRSVKEDAVGLTGFAAKIVNDKIATRNLSPNEPIGPGDFK